MVEVKSWKWRHGLLLAIRKGLQYFSNVQEAMREQWRSQDFDMKEASLPTNNVTNK
jgi:hypothetical protein